MKSSNLELQKIKRTQGKKLKFLFLFSIFSLTAGVFYGLLSTEDLLKIKDIQVSGAKTYVNKTDLETVVKGTALNKNYFAVNTTKIESDLKPNFLGAKEIEVSKQVTGKVKVTVTERKPIALLTQKDISYVVDEEGFVLGYMDPSTTNLPKIKYDGKVKVGFFIDKSLVPVYSDILKKLDEEKIKVSSISMNEYDVRMYVEKGTEVIIARKNYDGSFSARLKQVLNYLKTTGKSARSIDLRYDKVILSFN